MAFAGNSRIQIEFDDDTIEVFYLFDIVNPSSAPVTPKSELVFQLPEGAQQAAMLEGSSTQATIRGRERQHHRPDRAGHDAGPPGLLARAGGPGTGDRAEAAGRVGPGAGHHDDGRDLRGSARPSSPARTRWPAATASPSSLGNGGPLAAGQELALTLSGLPSRSRWGRNLSLGLAALVLLAGAWAALSSRSSSGDGVAPRRAGRAARPADGRPRPGGGAAPRPGTLDERRYEARHADLVAQLERVYGELDRQPGAAAET